MINIFQVAENDQSIYYLGQIFGNVGIGLAGSGPAILANMFRTFNTILLGIGAIFVVYITIVGVMQTAQEGEFMGKKWSSLWVPIRTVMGIAALFPTQSGYCALQVIIMWLIVQGIGAADQVWRTTTEYFRQGGGIIGGGEQTSEVTEAAADNNPNAALTPTKLEALFGGLVCQSIITKLKENNSNVMARSIQTDDGYYFLDSEGSCGKVTWSGGDEGVVTARKAAMSTLVPVMESLANQYVVNGINDPSCWDKNVYLTPSITGVPEGCTRKYFPTAGFTYDICPCRPGDSGARGCKLFNKYSDMWQSLPANCQLITKTGWNNILAFAGSNFIIDAVRMLSGYANNYAINQKVKDEQNKPITERDPWTKAQVNGWLVAGAYYYFIGQSDRGAMNDVSEFYNGIKVFSQKSKITNPDNTPDKAHFNIVTKFYCGGLDRDGNCLNGGALQLVKDAKESMERAQDIGGGVRVGGGYAGPSELGDLDAVTKLTLNTWIDAISGGGGAGTNPISNIHNFGKGMLIAAEVLFWIMIYFAPVIGVAATYYIALGTSLNPLPGMAATMALYFLPIFIGAITYMASIGALCAIYVPLIPYLFFTFGVIGWFIAVFEAMVAGPIIALGILSPGGQHEILGRAEPAALILLNILLRPTLMIFGMIGSMLLAYAVINIINAAFIGVVASTHGSGGHGGMGLLEAFLYVMAYAGLVITAMNKCFALIHMVPDRALRWIGGQAESYGEAEAAEQVKGKVTAGGEVAGRAGAGGIGAAKEAGSGLGKQEARKERRGKTETKPGPAVTPSEHKEENKRS